MFFYAFQEIVLYSILSKIFRLAIILKIIVYAVINTITYVISMRWVKIYLAFLSSGIHPRLQ